MSVWGYVDARCNWRLGVVFGMLQVVAGILMRLEIVCPAVPFQTSRIWRNQIALRPDSRASLDLLTPLFIH